MRSRFRLLSVVALAFLFFALPGSGLGADSRPGIGTGAGPSTGRGTLGVTGCTGAAAPTLVPGASVLTVGSAGAISFSASAGSTVVNATSSGCGYWYSSTGEPILVPLELPAGATIWQIDAYGYLTVPGFQTWELVDENTVGGDTWASIGTAASPSGTAMTHATMTFSSGATLAVGHHWFLFVGTNSGYGYVGAVVQ